MEVNRPSSLLSFLPHANFLSGPQASIRPFASAFLITYVSSLPFPPVSRVRTLAAVVIPTVCARARACGQLIAHARSRSPTRREKSEFRAEIRCTKKRIDSKGKPVARPLVTGRCTRSFRVFTRVANRPSIPDRVCKKRGLFPTLRAKESATITSLSLSYPLLETTKIGTTIRKRPSFSIQQAKRLALLNAYSSPSCART